jgi:hypothetical protein
VQIYTIGFLAAHLAVTRSETIALAREVVDSVALAATSSLASIFATKEQRGMTRQ